MEETVSSPHVRFRVSHHFLFITALTFQTVTLLNIQL